MPKYLMEVSYTAEGAAGVLKDGGSKRREVARKAVQSVGGSMESFYYAFGKNDVILICDMPDAATMAATSLTLAATGAITSRTTVLITAEEIDTGVKKQATYTPPGR